MPFSPIKIWREIDSILKFRISFGLIIFFVLMMITMSFYMIGKVIDEKGIFYWYAYFWVALLFVHVRNLLSALNNFWKVGLFETEGKIYEVKEFEDSIGGAEISLWHKTSFRGTQTIIHVISYDDPNFLSKNLPVGREVKVYARFRKKGLPKITKIKDISVLGQIVDSIN